MKALLVTGTLAENIVKQYAKQSKTQTEVLTLKTQVAALLTPQTIAQALKKIPLKNVDIILTPGQIRGDTKIIAQTINVPTFKGPRYAADLPVVLDSLSEVPLSTVVPACDLMREKIKQKAFAELQKVERNRDALLKKPGNMLIGNVAVGKDFPLRVLAEIVDAPLLETKEIQRLAKSYTKAGADLIDVGMLAGESRPLDAKRAVEAVKAAVELPVSIDTLNPSEIEAAVAAGAVLILSGDAGNLAAIAPFAKNLPIVVIPTNQRRGVFPQTPRARVRLLERLVKKAKQLGFSKIVGDLILEPTNVVDSFVAFQEFNRRNPDVPLLVGVANVVELFDADSVGLNALLARLCSEVNVDILLVTEKSPKTRGSVCEASTASKMMFLAKRRGSVPRDLGVDLLVLKEKVERETPFDKGLWENSKVINKKVEAHHSDPCGVFRILVDHEGGTLVVLHYESEEADKPLNTIRGVDAESLLAEVLRLRLVSQLDHAAYLGGELGKAEVALRVGRGYVQDVELFEKK